MNGLKLVRNALLIFTFLHLAMCPVPEAISNGYIDHIVVNKTQRSFELKQHSKEEGRSPVCCSAHRADRDAFYHVQITKKFFRFSSLYPSNSLSILSTTRLLI